MNGRDTGHSEVHNDAAMLIVPAPAARDQSAGHALQRPPRRLCVVTPSTCPGLRLRRRFAQVRSVGYRS
jgi:hypothetical protein